MARPFLTTPITDDRALGGSAIERSIRINMNEDTYFTRTPSSASNRKTFTISVWAKRSNLSGSAMFGGYIDNTDRATLRFNSNTVEFQSAGMSVKTSGVFRDISSWYHIVAAIDTTQGTQSNRGKIYVNGVEQSLQTNNLTQNHDTSVNNNSLQVVGTRWVSGGSNGPFDGYLTEFNLIDGQQLDASYFGYTDDVTGIWRPKHYEGTYGTNGFRLDFSDNSATTATTLGKDRSGNGNDFTPSNFSVAAGAGNDSLPDTPSNNFCTMNPLVPTPSTTWANGNLDLSGGTSDTYGQANLTTFGVSSGKWYAEVKITYSTTNVYVGVCPVTTPANTNLTGSVTDAAVLRMSNTTFIEGTETGSIFDSISSGDTIGIALDMDNLRVWFSKNGTYANSGNPVTGTNAIFSGITAGETMAIAARPLNGTLNFNFGQRPFSYTPPTGYKAWSTNNLLNHSLPSIINPKKHFDVVTYSGNDATGRSITDLEFPPDFIWVKNRSEAFSHALYDSVRGATKRLRSDNTAVEGTDSDGITSFDSNGWTMSGNDAVNKNGNNFVAWCWKAGGAAVANNDGTIATQVSVNKEAGFSIITYTGTGADATIGHGLGVSPAFVMTKRRDNNAINWLVRHKFSSKVAYLDLADRFDDNGSGQGIITNFNSSNYTVTRYNNQYNYGGVNSSGDAYVSYCWAEIPGYSKFGSYKGNGNADGPFVDTGFKPAFVMMKEFTDSSTNWVIYDNKRGANTYNPVDLSLYPNLSNVEGDASLDYDFVSNGFKVKTSNGGINGNGQDYIYMAFAESSGNTPYQTEPNAR